MVKLLAAHDHGEEKLLWSLHFKKKHASTVDSTNPSASTGVHILRDTSSDLAFNDEMLQQVRAEWQDITGESTGFMDFGDREVGAYDDEER